MLRVGLTGPAGSGKTTVAGLLAGRGFPVVDADRVAHELYVPGSPLVRALVRAFGRDILLPGGIVNREALGRLVFADPDRLAQLDRIVHPPLLDELARRFTQWERGGEPVGILEAAVLLQWGPPKFIDLVVGVTAPRALRVERLVFAGLEHLEAEHRADAQVSEEELAEKADILIENAGGLDRLQERVDELEKDLRRRSRPS
jgi:dephospho-CoA kinase